jgi:hypothetical protein
MPPPKSPAMRCLRPSFRAASFPRSGLALYQNSPSPRRTTPTTTGGRKGRSNYWDMYATTAWRGQSRLTADLHAVYNEPRFAESLERLEDFLLLAQMPDPSRLGPNTTTPCSRSGPPLSPAVTGGGPVCSKRCSPSSHGDRNTVPVPSTAYRKGRSWQTADWPLLRIEEE